jgi:transcriptional regulator
MSNNNLADISAFESLQNNANRSFGGSQMGAFQTDVTVTNSKEELEKLAKYENDVIIEYNKAKTELDKTEKGTPQYKELEKNIEFLRNKGNKMAQLKDSLYKKDVEHEKKVVAEITKNLPKKLEELLKAASTQLESPFK